MRKSNFVILFQKFLKLESSNIEEADGVLFLFFAILHSQLIIEI